MTWTFFRYLRQQTNTPDALAKARKECFIQASGDRPDVKNIAIVITDGVPYPANRRQPAIDEAKRLRDLGTSIIAIGITST